MNIEKANSGIEEKFVMDFTTWISLIFVAVMTFLITRPTPKMPQQVSLYMPTCVGMSVNSGMPREEINITIDFDDTLLWKGKAVSQIQFEKNLTNLWANHSYVYFVLNINPLASNRVTFDTLQKMQAHQKEYVVLSNNFTLY
ncbi:hypothetical protein [Undibacterium baiyunense]|uniref:Biopolymer transport protein ExbD/TolR n=1 Tax=Undibacterium baiyunense TaxID=2828731 RepID=A0A941DCQ0_9BURK|nr:hypothetical protein [Undibacterium baiyunense]MBR7745621.1 hypothetical protein [Undibacterium baiyunense]